MAGTVHLLYIEPDTGAKAEEMFEMKYLEPWRIPIPRGLTGSRSLFYYDPVAERIIHDISRKKCKEADIEIAQALAASGHVPPTKPQALQSPLQYPFKHLKARKRAPCWLDGDIADYSTISPRVFPAKEFPNVE